VTERVTGPYSLLKHAAVYGALQHLLGAPSVRDQFARKYIRAKIGDRVLDIGCGSACILSHLPKVEYHGWDPNPRYIAQARRIFAGLGRFHTGLFGSHHADALGKVDIVILSAVLHHMTDADATDLFALLRRVVKSGGRVVSLDNVLVEYQSPIARLLIRFDRGRHVRSPRGYEALARYSFQGVAGEVVHRAFPPSTYFYMTAQ
jgi:SAM-dependent methyltransferase